MRRFGVGAPRVQVSCGLRYVALACMYITAGGGMTKMGAKKNNFEVYCYSLLLLLPLPVRQCSGNSCMSNKITRRDYFWMSVKYIVSSCNAVVWAPYLEVTLRVCVEIIGRRLTVQPAVTFSSVRIS